MQNVSTNWKENQLKDIVNEAFVRLGLYIVDAQAQDDITPSANGEEEYSNISEVTDGLEGVYKNYATCEGVWLLDGSSYIMPDVTPDSGIGYVSDKFSGSDLKFDVDDKPEFTMEFSSVHDQSLVGLTLIWAEAYNEYATDFNVDIYRSDILINSIHIKNNGSPMSIIESEISNYDKIVITVNKWNRPYHRARIEEITTGLKKTYGKESILSYSHKIECDPISSGLPKTEMTYSIDNTKGEWNPENNVGFSKYLIERQEVSAEYGYKLNDSIEWIKGGTFWLSNWDMPSNGISASFTAKGLTDFLSENYTGALAGTLYDIAHAALLQANLPKTRSGENRWYLDECLNDISINNITGNYSHSIAETLQLIASAACCTLYQDREGILNIRQFEPSLTDYPINKFNSYQFGEYSLQKPLKSLVINNGLYTSVPAITGEIVSSDNPFIQTQEMAYSTGEWMKNWLSKRKSLTGQFRADPRLDVLDGVKAENRFALAPLLITSIEYSFNGAFAGSYTGRLYTDILESVVPYVGEYYLGGVI